MQSRWPLPPLSRRVGNGAGMVAVVYAPCLPLLPMGKAHSGWTLPGGQRDIYQAAQAARLASARSPLAALLWPSPPGP